MPQHRSTRPDAPLTEARLRLKKALYRRRAPKVQQAAEGPQPAVQPAPQPAVTESASDVVGRIVSSPPSPQARSVHPYIPPVATTVPRVSRSGRGVSWINPDPEKPWTFVGRASTLSRTEKERYTGPTGYGTPARVVYRP